MHTILRVENLVTGYGKKPILHGMDLTIVAGEIVLIAGSNGSGKSTLLRAIYGLLAPWNPDGRITYQPESGSPGHDTSQPALNLGRGLAFVPQKNAVFADLTVEDNLALAGNLIRDRREFRIRLEEVLSVLPALAANLGRTPQQMSGGEKQLLACGMVLLHRPRLILFDEPTAGLSPKSVALLLAEMKRLHDLFKMTLVIVEHRLRELLPLAQRLVGLKLGRLERDEVVKPDFNPESLKSLFT